MKGINLHIVRNSVSNDSRVLKETSTLLHSGLFSDIKIFGFSDPRFREKEVLNGLQIWRVPIATRKLKKDLLSQSVKYLEWYLRVVSAARNNFLTAIHCHDLGPLPIAARLKTLHSCKLIYDAHELETEVLGLKGLRKWLAQITEFRLINKADAIITVSPSIRNWYCSHFPNKPIYLIRNIPKKSTEPNYPSPLRNHLKIPDESLLFIYLGGLSGGRGIEMAIKAFQDPRVSHHVLFMGDGHLKEQVKTASTENPKIHYRPPVPPDAVIEYAAGADIGLCLYEDNCLNHRYCLPNKLFEYLTSGIPVLATNLVDQTNIVESYNAGWIVRPTFESVVKALTNLTIKDARALREQLDYRVSDLHWQNESVNLLNCYEEALK